MKLLSLLLAAVTLATLAGCASVDPHMMPTPVLFKSPQLDFSPNLPTALRSTLTPVF